jgi:hypothetical protein
MSATEDPLRTAAAFRNRRSISTPSRAAVRSAGEGFRLKGQLLKKEFNLNGPTLHVLLRYTQSLIPQMAQTAVCNRHHSVD